MENKLQELNYTNFEQWLKERTALVDFWAEWCHPCTIQHKMLEEISEETSGLFEIATVNVDDNRTISMKLGVQNIPAMILFQNGSEIKRFTGLQNKKLLLSQIANTLKDEKI